MDSDLLYLVVLPALLATAFWALIKPRKLGVAAVSLALYVVALASYSRPTLNLSFDRETLVAFIAFIALPVAGAAAGWRLVGSRPHRWLVFVLAPAGYFVGVLFGMYLWMGSGGRV